MVGWVTSPKTKLKIINTIVFFKESIESFIHDLFYYFVDVRKERYRSVICKIKVRSFVFKNWNYFWCLQFVNIYSSVEWKINDFNKWLGIVGVISWNIFVGILVGPSALFEFNPLIWLITSIESVGFMKNEFGFSSLRKWENSFPWWWILFCSDEAIDEK